MAVAAGLQGWAGLSLADPIRAETVTAVLDADTLRLDDSREVRLAGLRISARRIAGATRPAPCCRTAPWAGP